MKLSALRWNWIASAVLTLLMPGVAPIAAQNGTACSYHECALRVEREYLVQGANGQRVGKTNVFYSDLRILYLGPDSTRLYAARYEQKLERSFWLGVSGLALIMAGPIGYGLGDQDRGATFTLLTIAGTGLGVWAGANATAAQTALSRSIWWFNRAAANAETLPHFNQLPPLHPAHFGRGGAVVGSFAGLGVGLAVSSRHSSTETTQGILETAGSALVGGIVGWLIGASIER